MSRQINHFKVIGKTNKGLYILFLVSISPEGDIYIRDGNKNFDAHLSRHKDGKTHHKIVYQKETQVYGEHLRSPSADLKGIECLQTVAFSLDIINKFYEPFVFKKNTHIFPIDLRNWANKKFNIIFSTFPLDLIESMFNYCSEYIENQLYVYTNSSPAIGINIINVDSRKK